MPCESENYHRRLGSLLLYLCYVTYFERQLTPLYADLEADVFRGAREHTRAIAGDEVPQRRVGGGVGVAGKLQAVVVVGFQRGAGVVGEAGGEEAVAEDGRAPCDGILLELTGLEAGGDVRARGAAEKRQRN